MKWVPFCRAFVLAILACTLMTGQAGCRNDKDDKEDKPESISGDSTLRVQNDFHITQRILFNDRYIGDVATRSSRSWNVPSGRHKVTARDSTTGDVTRYYNFSPGRITVVRVYGSVRHLERRELEAWGLEGEQFGLPDEKHLR